CFSLVGCGDDDGPSPTDTGPPPPEAGTDSAVDAGSDAGPADAGDVEPDASNAPPEILEVPRTATFRLPGLTEEAHVIRTPHDVPHIYSVTREDAARIQGFLLARDRFFMLDLVRRFALATVSELLGELGLEIDLENRGIGTTTVTEEVLGSLTPELEGIFDAYAEGINAYIEAVRNRMPGISSSAEHQALALVMGVRNPAEIMAPFARRDVAALAGTVTYNLGFETGDVGRARAVAAIPAAFEGAALGDLRRAGLRGDIYDRVLPVNPIASAYGWGNEGRAAPIVDGRGRIDSRPRIASPRRRFLHRVPEVVFERLAHRLERIENRLGHDHEHGWGSNAWAVDGTGTPDGAALLAGDGHLGLDIPPLFYQIGIDTSVLGGEDLVQAGMTIVGVPMLAPMTNGHIAFSQTQLAGDVTDWYREELRLDASGLPATSRFDGEDRPLERIDETYSVRDVPALDSVGRTETWPRWTTFDGRWITEIEGRSATADETLAPGESLVRLLGSYVVPGDVNGDGVITAISFDFGGFADELPFARAVHAFGQSRSVEEFFEHMRGLVAYSQNIVAADDSGSVLYSGYQATPCRGYLPRNPDGSWAEGADPTMLLDGTTYGGFEIPVVDGRVDEGPGATDPYRCVVPFDQYPHAIDPERGYVLTANNDPGGITLDGTMNDDPYYIGGPWDVGYRADRIDRELRRLHDAGIADEDAMSELHGNHVSRLDEQMLPVLMGAIAAARAAAAGTPAPGSAEERMAAMYRASRADWEEVEARLSAWADRGLNAASGVETFYDSPSADDRLDAVATMIFNAWEGRYEGDILDDERIDGAFFGRPWSRSGKMRLVTLMLESRGENTHSLLSWNPETRESAYFDVLGTPEIETSDELALRSLDDALVFLRSPSTGDGFGGFGHDDWDRWLWGLRHWVRFDSLVGGYLPADSDFSAITDRFSVNTSVLPLAEGLTPDDPRSELSGFPRPGDSECVDAAGDGNGERFNYGAGPVFRFVVALRPDGTTARNALPGGQSGNPSSEFFADQARLWLGNETRPVHITLPQVLSAAVSRERYLPAAP
ncbi:MAG: penicillin acylase family protein, partial [Deltaproteobacteria bacterium]|nr:penicillin acylase family protein [Deltaproteobacteria bacterium]